MNNVNLTVTENALLSKVDSLLELCLPTNSALFRVPKFVEELNSLRDKRNLVNEESVKRHEAESSKETLVATTSTEKEALIKYLDDAMGTLRAFAKKEKDAALTKILPTMMYSNLVKCKTLELISCINTFIAIVEKLDATTLESYGIEKTWLPTVKSKVVDYKALNTTKEASKTNKPKATSQFKSVIAEIKEHINLLTDMVGGYKNDALEFHDSCVEILSPKKKAAKRTAKKRTAKSLMKASAKKTKKAPKNTEVNEEIIIPKP